MNVAALVRLAALSLIAPAALADGFAVDKVYHPYVEPMEQELEWRMTGYDDSPSMGTSGEIYRLGYGRAIGERWFGELYLIGERTSGENLELAAYEVEALYQLTEQGEFWADWGLLVELEKEQGDGVWEAAAGILAEKEFGQWSATANLLLINEWGEHIEDEVESQLALQARYRYQIWLEPAIEFHSAEDTKALGPVLLGDIPLADRRNIHWETGAFAGLDEDTPDYSFRAAVEYEF
jgi:hypothetical protein